MPFDTLRIYFSEYWRGRKAGAPLPNLLALLRDFPAWRASLGQDDYPLKTHTPWIAISCRRFLDKIVTNDMRVLEYGAGGSTLYFAERVKELVTVEHSPEWLEAVRREMPEKILASWDAKLLQPKALTEDSESDEIFRSRKPGYEKFSFEAYAKTAERYPDQYFNIVMIDGRARVACVKCALSRVKVGGYLILDNADAPEYQDATASMPRWMKPTHFYGPCYNYVRFTLTSVWQRMDVYLSSENCKSC